MNNAAIKDNGPKPTLALLKESSSIIQKILNPRTDFKKAL